jgi:hypothetical protein
VEPDDPPDKMQGWTFDSRYLYINAQSNDVT